MVVFDEGAGKLVLVFLVVKLRKFAGQVVMLVVQNLKSGILLEPQAIEQLEKPLDSTS